jgi:sucrose phosphorylase
MTPETFAFIDRLTDLARQRGLEVLVEIHAHHEHQLAVAARVDLVYDFALPPLVLHALQTGDGTPLRRWLQLRPRNAVTVLDTHDGIGVVDVGPDGAGRPGLLDAAQLHDLVERIHTLSGGGSRLATGAAASNLDLYQVNCTYYDALGRDDARYLLARLLQFFVPGIPQVYYVGLLAGTNDLDLLARTGVGRDVNRHHYAPAELAEALQRPVVRDLLAAIRFRNTHPAFAGTWALANGPDDVVTMTWTAGAESATLTADLAAGTFELEFTTAAGRVRVTDLGALPAAG